MMLIAKSKMSDRYSPGIRAGAARIMFKHKGSYDTQAGGIVAIAAKFGCIPQTLREWVKSAEKDSNSHAFATHRLFVKLAGPLTLP